MNHNATFHYSGSKINFTMCKKDRMNEPELEFAWGRHFSELFDMGINPKICDKCEAINKTLIKGQPTGPVSIDIEGWYDEE